MSSVGSKEVDLEEGEIEEDILEDISDCSLSEALVTQKDLEHDSDIERLRAEALKSLQEDEVSEEELYRLEALKSLLTNIESSEKISPAEEIRKKKRKHKKKSRRKKAIKIESSEVLKTENDCEESKLLVEACEERISTSQLDNFSSNMDFSDKENQTDSDMNLVTRSWYPKTDFALLNFGANEMSNETKQRPRRNRGNDDFIIIPRILSVTNNDTKSTVNDTTPKGKPVDQSLKFSRVEMPIHRVSAPISKLNCSVLPSAAHLSRYKKISKHQIQKYPVIQPTSRFSLRNYRKGKYKLVNKSCYSLKKSVNPSPTKPEKQNTLSKSVYSLNRVQKQPDSSKPSPFIIELNEDDSGKEDDGSVMPAKKPKSGVRNSDVLPSKMRYSELPCRELPDRLISSRTPESSSFDECVAEISSSVVEKEMEIESFAESMGETEKEVSADSPNDEAMHLLEVTTSTALTTSCYDASFSDNEHISPGVYSKEINDKTEVSEVIPDAIDDCPAISLSTYSEEKKIEETAEIQTSPNRCSQDMNSQNRSDVLKITPHIEECDVSFLPQANSISKCEGLAEESELLNVAVCTPEDCGARLVVKEEPFDFDPAENLSLEGDTECDVANDAEINKCENLMVLEDAEASLIEIRARLLLNLGELEEGLKKDESEKEKLNTMLKKLLVLKSSVLQFENKIRAYQSKMSIHADTVQVLFEECAARTDTCAHMKNVCFRVGTGIKGPQYKPPDLYENVIEEKIRAIDFSKFMPN